MHYSCDQLDMTTESLSGNIAFNSWNFTTLFKYGQPLAGNETRDVHAHNHSCKYKVPNIYSNVGKCYQSLPNISVQT